MGCHDTFTLWRLESITFKLLISSSVNCGRVVANQVCWSCRRIHENWQKCGCCLESGPVEASQPYWWLRPWLIRADKVCCCCTVQSCNLFIPDHSETGWWVSAGLSDSILSATISMDQQRGLPSQSSSQSGSARSKGAFQLFLTGVWPFVSRCWFCLTPLEFWVLCMCWFLWLRSLSGILIVSHAGSHAPHAKDQSTGVSPISKGEYIVMAWQRTVIYYTLQWLFHAMSLGVAWNYG